MATLEVFPYLFCLFIKCAMVTLRVPTLPTHRVATPPHSSTTQSSHGRQLCEQLFGVQYNRRANITVWCARVQKVNNRNANRLLLLLLLSSVAVFTSVTSKRERQHERQREREQRAQSANYSCLCYVYYYSTTISNSCYCSFGQAEATRHRPREKESERERAVQRVSECKSTGNATWNDSVDFGFGPATTTRRRRCHKPVNYSVGVGVGSNVDSDSEASDFSSCAAWLGTTNSVELCQPKRQERRRRCVGCISS